MNPSPSNDPLVALWRTAPKPDTQHLLQELQRLKKTRQLLERIVLALLCSVTVMLIVAEATDHIATHGILSVVWIAALAVGLGWRRRIRCNHIDALASDTVSLLKYMLARAKSDLVIARYLYAGAPCGALAGGLAMKLLGGAASPAATPDHPQIQMILTVAGATVLLIMVVTGIVLARDRSRQVKALSEKLRLVEAGL